LRQLLQAPAGAITTDSAIGLALQRSLHLTFWTMLLMSLAMVCLAVFVPHVEMRQAPDAVKAE
jgi:hypothetical protein